jgi:AcrR family transcriptional regulator
MTDSSRAARQKPRRRPLQARSWATSLAVQEAFVRVLLARGYDGVTIREVAAVAGVGIGTFYAYFPNKEALAAVCLRTRMKAVVTALAELSEPGGVAEPAALVDAMLDRMVAQFAGSAAQWQALLHLERRISTPEAYARLYRMATDMWAAALRRALRQEQPGGPEQAAALEQLAWMVHTASYALLTQRIMQDGPKTDATALRRQLGLLVHACLAAEDCRQAPKPGRAC